MRPSKVHRERTALQAKALLAARYLVDHMRTLYRELEQLTGAPITLHRTLLCIGEEPGLAASRLALRLGLKRPAMSQVLKNLAARGWIERRRTASDQRSVHIHLTTEGRQILKLTDGRAVGTLKRAVNGLSPENLHSLASGLDALLSNLAAAAPLDAGNAKRSPRLRAEMRN